MKALLEKKKMRGITVLLSITGGSGIPDVNRLTVPVWC